MEGHRPDAPNIILITADQLAASFVGCYGSGVNSTPCLDTLAHRGTQFTRYYASSPVCAPNRATMLTGVSPEIHGIVSNHFALPNDTPTFAHVLRQHGYRTGIFGKIHQTPMQWAPPDNVAYLGFDESVISEDPKWGPWLDWVQAHHPDHYAAALAMTNSHSGVRGPDLPMDGIQGGSEEQRALKAQVYEDAMQKRMDASAWDRMYPSPLPAEVHDTVFITECGLDFIQRAARHHAEPFFCQISYVDPHDSYDPPEPYASMFDPDAMPDPLPAEWKAQGPAFLDKVRDGYLNFRAICEDTPAIKKLRALYHGSVRLIDDQIQRLVNELEAMGLWENTILVFTSDHGDMMGDHGLIAKGVPHYDSCIRCPLIVTGADINQDVSDRLLCTLDLFPTLCDWAGVPTEDIPPYEGMSFAVPGHDRQDIVVSIGPADSIITADGWRLTRYSHQDTGQLFNLQDDPAEQHNLYDEPGWSGRKIHMLERLVKLRAAPRLQVQYRTLPSRDNHRWNATNNRSWPDYQLQPSPWVEPGPKPEWQGSPRMGITKGK
ncbi:MAG: sulfatase-like hydrolase/transferase [Anaerolineae bacterium]|nr:sulfatase-like hydrolase/transferase [Anaerolineae bacterium]